MIDRNHPSILYKRTFFLYTNIHSVDWQNWQPHDIATLLFLFDKENVLLIRKKRGLGVGKINAPGGKLEPEETIEQCAIRELEEEVGLLASNIIPAGENLFQFVDGYSIHVHVFIGYHYQGALIETEEAKPFWVHQNNIPYDEMWEDDYLWVPYMLQRLPFVGKYLFDEDRMVDSLIKVHKK